MNIFRDSLIGVKRQILALKLGVQIIFPKPTVSYIRKPPLLKVADLPIKSRNKGHQYKSNYSGLLIHQHRSVTDMTHQIRNCRKRQHRLVVQQTKSRRLVHETDSNFVVLADEDITKTMNHPMPVRIIRHSSATVVEMEYTRNLKFLREIYADSSSVGSTITDKMQILPSLNISLLFILSFTACILSVLYMQRK